MSTVEIREATVADAEQLAAVYRDAFAENRRLGLPNDAESVRESQVADWIQETLVYVATVDGDVIGGLRLQKTDDTRVKLSDLAVRERWKGNGVGSDLLDYAEKRVRERDESTLWLQTPAKHPYLPGMYRRRGYEKIGAAAHAAREFEFIVLEKQLR